MAHNIVVTQVTERFSMRPIMNGYPSVDSFFVMSGVLVSYLMFKELDRNKGKVTFLPMAYLHRYLRYVDYIYNIFNGIITRYKF